MNLRICTCALCAGLILGNPFDLAKKAGAMPCFIEQPCERALPLADMPEPDHPRWPASAGAGMTINQTVTSTATFFAPLLGR